MVAWFQFSIKFFNNDTFTKLGVSTNDFGHAYVKMWTNLSLSELAAFLGLIVHMGLINYTGIRCKLWQNTRKGKLFTRTVMTNERFEQILKAWHYEYYSEYTEEKIKQLKALDPFWPIASWVQGLKPGQFLNMMSSVSPGKAKINAVIITNQNQLKGTSK